MRVTQDNYLKLKRSLLDELITDVNSAYQLGSDRLSDFKRSLDYQHVLQVLGCFDDDEAIHDVERAHQIFNSHDNEDAEDQIESWLDRANLD